MREIWTYALSKARNELFSELQTNGFFSKKICDWVGDHIDMVWISCDGPPDIQNYYRPTRGGGACAPVVERNILALSKAGKGVGIRATIGNINISRQREMIDYFASLGIKAIFADHMCKPVSELVHMNKTYKLVEVEPLEYAKSFLEAKKYTDEKGIFYSNFLLVNFDEPVEIACRAMLPTPQLNPSGYVSSCDMATDVTGGRMDDLIYGYFEPETGNIIHYLCTLYLAVTC